MDTSDWKYQLGDHVVKKSGADWCGPVVGFYSSSLTERGYAVESSKHHGAVQIYPESALELVEEERSAYWPRRGPAH